MTVSENGCYNFIIKSNVNMIGYIYTHYFDELNPNSNLFIYHSGNKPDVQYNFTIQLDITTKYILVVSTYYPYITGKFSIVVSGPANVSFNHISKSIIYKMCGCKYILIDSLRKK